MALPFRQKTHETITKLLGRKKIHAVWWESKNWGDALNPVLIRHLSGRDPVPVREFSQNLKHEPLYTVIGSILHLPVLQDQPVLKNTIIWGTGFIDASGRLQGRPRRVCAVRGPLTRDSMIKSGVFCPEIYGDPALLYPRFYRPDIARRWKLGIVPHYADKGDPLVNRFMHSPEIRIIDIEGGVNAVVDQVCSCSCIASSSLHGLILADAYRIPSVYLKISDRVLGHGFKFRDYFASVGRPETEPLAVSEQTTPDDILETGSCHRIDIDLDALLDACPFYNHKRS
jgi:pyruvyltransferase